MDILQTSLLNLVDLGCALIEFVESREKGGEDYF